MNIEKVLVNTIVIIFMALCIYVGVQYAKEVWRSAEKEDMFNIVIDRVKVSSEGVVVQASKNTSVKIVKEIDVSSDTVISIKLKKGQTIWNTGKNPIYILLK